MKKLFVILALLFTNFAHSIEVIDGKLVLNPTETYLMTKCIEQGGCHVITTAGVMFIVNKAVEITIQEYGCKKV